MGKKSRHKEKDEEPMEIEAVAEPNGSTKKRKNSLKSPGDTKESKSSSKKSSKKRRKRESELAHTQTNTDDAVGGTDAAPSMFKDAVQAGEDNATETKPAANAPSAKSFPLVSGLSLPMREDVKSMSGKDQHKFFTALGSSCEKLLRLIDEVETETSLWRDAAPDMRDSEEAAMALEDTLVADMARLKNAPIARQFTEMSLWKRLKKFNEKQLAHIATLQKLDGDDDDAKKKEAPPDGERKREFVSFKQAHMKHMTSTYEKDLEEIRNAESLDVVGVETLLRCLDVSTDLYAESLVRKQEERERLIRL